MHLWPKNTLEILCWSVVFFSCIYRGRDLCYKASSKVVSKIFMYKKGLWIYNCRCLSKEYQEKVIYNICSVTIHLFSEGVYFEEHDIDVKFELHKKLKQCWPAGQTE